MVKCSGLSNENFNLMVQLKERLEAIIKDSLFHLYHWQNVVSKLNVIMTRNNV